MFNIWTQSVTDFASIAVTSTWSQPTSMAPCGLPRPC